MNDSRPPPHLSLWERLDLLPATLQVLTSFLYNAVAGVARGSTGAKEYGVHVVHATFRTLGGRLSGNQISYLQVPTTSTYESIMRKTGLKPETVQLAHGAKGHWIGDSNAKHVLVYYHGGGFILTAHPGHFNFFARLVTHLKSTGHDMAVFFIEYYGTPQSVYPVQLRQAVEGLRYILATTNRSPSDVIIGGDSAGGNLALATLLHLAHPHPEIEKLDISSPLAGVFTFSPWVNFTYDYPSMEKNKYKDILGVTALVNGAAAYLDGRPGDSWSEPSRAPIEWWKDAGEKVANVLFLAGADEILLDSVDDFVKKFQSVVPNTTYVVGHQETHVSLIYTANLLSQETQQEKELKRWLAARL